MKKTMRYIGMAALAMAGAIIIGCTENDLAENLAQNNNKTLTLTTTIRLDDSAATRALEANGKKTFAKDEEIALIYEDADGAVQKVVSNKLTEKDIANEGKDAALSFALKKAPKKEGAFAMIYPASMAQETLPDGGEFGDCAAPNYAALDIQDGTLESLSTKLDLATCDSKFTADATLPNSISLTNGLAIVALTIKDHAGNDITGNITSLTLKTGSNNSYTVNREAAAEAIYVAMRPVDKEDISITATDGRGQYDKKSIGKTLQAGSLSPITVEMQKVVSLKNLDTGYLAQDGDILTDELRFHVKITIAAGATVTLRDVKINAEDATTPRWTEGDHAGITCFGEATIILEGDNIVQGFADGYPGIQAAYNTARDTDPSLPEFTLNIKGSGSLKVIGSANAEGIGGGNVSIFGGTVTAIGGKEAYAFGNFKLEFPKGMALYDASTDPYTKMSDGPYSNFPPEIRYIAIK